ncbi:hypothetical protein DFR70_109120 [Nocardia tenerifensis]|uniref:Uncharacterized protein n=1 Tax=Nocardia tenerifensis TaxID=228006 RepID=A0A318JWF4_9NOCA|nr:hypothetical protein [Nocardia tenerifensis]PXX60929.1 hypothetical protein DFR70_109120 [Nocardia tenerifensis]
MRTQSDVATLGRGAVRGLGVGALGALGVFATVALYFHDGGSKDHTSLEVGDCWDYSTRFEESVHVKPCSEPHYGEVILSAQWSGTTVRANFCEQQLSVILAKNRDVSPYSVPTNTILCAVTSTDHADTRIGGLTGKVDR